MEDYAAKQLETILIRSGYFSTALGFAWLKGYSEYSHMMPFHLFPAFYTIQIKLSEL